MQQEYEMPNAIPAFPIADAYIVVIMPSDSKQPPNAMIIKSKFVKASFLIPPDIEYTLRPTIPMTPTKNT
jgi:hypothetical protein